MRNTFISTNFIYIFKDSLSFPTRVVWGRFKTSKNYSKFSVGISEKKNKLSDTPLAKPLFYNLSQLP